MGSLNEKSKCKKSKSNDDIIFIAHKHTCVYER